MAVTLKQVEADPATYPAPPDLGGVNLEGASPAHWDTIWKRLEDYTAHRWTPREVVWTVEGAGEWTPPLTPATITTAEVWERGGWSAVTLPEGPFGYELPGDGPYRITATVGHPGELVEGAMVYPVPPAIQTAARRLALYLVADVRHAAMASATSIEVSQGKGDGIEDSVSYERSATWIARAMQHSGAADLLRAYRRAP